MFGTRPVCFVLSIAASLGGGCSGKQADPPPGKAAPGAPAPQAARTPDASQAAVAPVDAAIEPAEPVISMFRRRYTPDESLPDRMRRRIRYHLRSQTKAPIALHHITHVPQANGGAGVFGIYEYSAYEDCVLGHADRDAGREECLGEPVTITEQDPTGTIRLGEKEVRLNEQCVRLGVVRAHFEPTAPGIPADAGGTVILWSAKLADSLCQVSDFHRLFVADLDGDERLEMYIDVTTTEETANVEVSRSGSDKTTLGHHFKRHLYLFAGDDANGLALSTELASWWHFKGQSEELVELRDTDGDRRLDVIQKAPCFGARSEQSCGGSPRRQTVHVYDVKRDAWIRRDEAKEAKEAKEAESKGSNQPAAGEASRP